MAKIIYFPEDRIKREEPEGNYTSTEVSGRFVAEEIEGLQDFGVELQFSFKFTVNKEETDTTKQLLDDAETMAQAVDMFTEKYPKAVENLLSHAIGAMRRR
ncbi:MAG: hypothetical protein JSU72_03705 [Deltaproteobacteria bacterium]|nr:MAG: hypothetical protein JSU72_03705 [Deltaproteobacteria bacterium]